MAALGLPWLAGCEDASVDPLASLETTETVPSLALAVPLPSMKELAVRVPGNVELERAVRIWDESWYQEDGDLLRIEARGAAVPLLFDALGASAVRDALSSLDWVESDPQGLSDAPESIARQVSSAALLLERGRESLDRGDARAALAWVLGASDELRVVTDEGIARQLVGRCERLIQDEDGSELEVARARRLMNGARRALANEEYQLAIERAFYAGQLLEDYRESR
jgi:hypothetical protein